MTMVRRRNRYSENGPSGPDMAFMLWMLVVLVFSLLMTNQITNHTKFRRDLRTLDSLVTEQGKALRVLCEEMPHCRQSSKLQ